MVGPDLTVLHLPSMVGSGLTELRSVHSIFSWLPSYEVSTEIVDDSLSISSTVVLSINGEVFIKRGKTHLIFHREFEFHRA